jgi:hypothetical protein
LGFTLGPHLCKPLPWSWAPRLGLWKVIWWKTSSNGVGCLDLCTIQSMAPTSLFLNLLLFNLRIIIITIKRAIIPIVVEGIGRCSRSLMKIYYSRFLSWKLVIEKIGYFSKHLLKTCYCYKILLWTCLKKSTIKDSHSHLIPSLQHKM